MRSPAILSAVGLLALAAAPARADSLWPAAGEPGFQWFSDTKARRVGDIVTILIKEQSTATTDLSQSEQKDTATTAVIKQICHVLGINKGGDTSSTGDTGLPSVDWNSARKFDAKAKAESKEALELQVSAVVKEILPNGNLIVEGHREIRHDYDRRLIHISGLVRPTDITPSNTVLSEHIAQARVSYEGDGPASQTKNKGWANRILEAMWPF